MTPTKGRIVFFHPAGAQNDETVALPAIVLFARDDGSVKLEVFGEDRGWIPERTDETVSVSGCWSWPPRGN